MSPNLYALLLLSLNQLVVISLKGKFLDHKLAVKQITSLRVCFSFVEFSLARYSDTAVYANNSVIDSNLVGEGYEEPQITNGGALECHTDDTTCCRETDNPDELNKGEWYFPNRTAVQTQNNSGSGSRLIYMTRHHMVIRLNRVSNNNNIEPPVGVYQCRIPNAEGVIITRNISLGRGGKQLLYIYCFVIHSHCRQMQRPT